MYHKVTVTLEPQQLVGLATEVDEGGDVAVLPGSEALPQLSSGGMVTATCTCVNKGLEMT